MKAEILLIVVVVLVGISEVKAVDIDFYEDGIIQEGNVYEFVTIHDTEPFHTTVDMFGGFAHSLTSYDSSTFNLNGGTIELLNVWDTSTANLYGGAVDLHLQSYDLAAVNMFVLDYNVQDLGEAGDIISGHWGDGSEFSIYLRGPVTYDRVTVNVIPEPASFCLLGLSTLVLRIGSSHFGVKT